MSVQLTTINIHYLIIVITSYVLSVSIQNLFAEEHSSEFKKCLSTFTDTFMTLTAVIEDYTYIRLLNMLRRRLILA